MGRKKKVYITNEDVVYFMQNDSDDYKAGQLVPKGIISIDAINVPHDVSVVKAEIETLKAQGKIGTNGKRIWLL
jgi:hypothetical protein